MFDPMASLPKWHRDVIAETERREAREMEAEEAERRDRQDTASRMAEHYEAMVEYRTGHSSAELREAASNAAVAAEMRNRQDEWGSATRAAVFVTGAEGQIIRLQPREEASGPVTVRSDSPAAQLARARQQPGREFMQRQVAELERRQRGGKRTISRSETPGTIQCLECIEENVTVDEYLALHHGDDPLPETSVPSYPPSQRSRRTRSGTGWPVITR